jgi:hypothetical protein
VVDTNVANANSTTMFTPQVATRSRPAPGRGASAGTGLMGCGEREPDGEGAAVTGLRFGTGGAAVCGDELADHRETDTGSDGGAAVPATPEPVEDVWQVDGFDAGSGVGDPDTGVVVDGVDTDPDVIAGSAVAGGVGQQVGDGLVQPVGIGVHRDGGRDVAVEFQVGTAQVGLLGVERGGDEIGEVDRSDLT